jgi:excisionase family DNA binding protein
MVTAVPVEVVTYAEACDLLRISRSSLQRLIRTGDLRVVVIGARARRIDRASITAYVDRR